MQVPLSVLNIVGVTQKESVRFNFDQVLFGGDERGQYAVASNAKTMLVARWDGEPTPEFGVPATAIRELRNIALRSTSEVKPKNLELFAGGSASWTATLLYPKRNVTICGAEPEGRFPPWRPVMEKFTHPQVTVTLTKFPFAALEISKAMSTMVSMAPSAECSDAILSFWHCESWDERKPKDKKPAVGLLLTADDPAEWPAGFHVQGAVMGVLRDE